MGEASRTVGGEIETLINDSVVLIQKNNRQYTSVLVFLVLLSLGVNDPEIGIKVGRITELKANLLLESGLSGDDPVFVESP